MKLRKILSGGQTGADRTALECAKALGLETGGTAPKGYRVDGGTDRTLIQFGLVEHESSDFAPRTQRNVQDADATVWIGKIGSPGYWCTLNATQKYNKPWYPNPTPLQLDYIANTYDTVNFAGNRKRLNPDVVRLTQVAFGHFALLMDKQKEIVN